jgi:hypothetical protein
MAEHRNLTGDSLHEPKGVETATLDQVYAADGAGSGTWKARLAGILNLNKFMLNGIIPDVSTTGSTFFAVVPYKGSLTNVTGILSGAITTANSTLTIYKNNVSQTPTVAVPFSGSGPGVVTSTAISPAITFNAGDTVEVRSNGASDAVASLNVNLLFTAIA